VAELFHVSDPLRVVFTLNVTHALNLALRGLLRPGDRVVTSSVEHNSVARPLRALKEQGVEVVAVCCAPDGSLDVDAFERAVTPGTRLVVVTHASNVVGTILPVERIADVAHRAGALCLVDTAHTAGVVPIDQPGMGIDLLAFTGHKGLHGPPGTGGLVIGDRVDLSELQPLMRGGTGSHSESDEQPCALPDKYESGTPNGVGIAGLAAGIRCVLGRTVEAIRAHEQALRSDLVSGLQTIPGIRVYGPSDSAATTAVVSCRVDGQHVSEVGLRLDEEFGILCRVGLHCAPAAHRTIGTFPEGTIRLAPGMATSPDDIRSVVSAMREIAKSR
jgi:cysteine desulfurase / selenocysteine lyase